MNEENLRKFVSMIIQDLRAKNYDDIIQLIKSSEYFLEIQYHDNWNGGVDYYNLEFYIDYSELVQIGNKKESYEAIIYESVNKILDDETIVINAVSIKAKIKQFIDWKAIAPKENKSTVIEKLTKEKSVLIATGTGITSIKDGNTNEDYKKLHKELKEILKQICLEHTNSYNDLWEWYSDYNEKGLTSYQSRRNFIKDMYQPLFDAIENSAIEENKLIRYEPTGWDKVDEAVYKMRDTLSKALITEDYQAVGMYGREILISLAKIVFDKEKHESVDGIEIGNSDSKRMLEAYINYCLKQHRSNPREIKFAKSSIDFSNELTHNRTANLMDAELCYTAVISTVNIIRTINKYNI